MANQNLAVEMDIRIMDSSAFKTLSEKTLKFNLSEYSKVEELNS